MSVSETLICPHCGKEQYTHEPDDIGTYYCLEECEHCGELFWYSIEVSRSYSVMDYDQNGLVSLGVGRMSEWIGVDERLPEPNLPVLTYGRKGGVGIGYVTDSSVSEYKRSNKLYFYARYGDKLPTHWMPMPEPPKEAEK